MVSWRMGHPVARPHLDLTRTAIAAASSRTSSLAAAAGTGTRLDAATLEALLFRLVTTEDADLHSPTSGATAPAHAMATWFAGCFFASCSQMYSEMEAYRDLCCEPLPLAAMAGWSAPA